MFTLYYNLQSGIKGISIAFHLYFPFSTHKLEKTGIEYRASLLQSLENTTGGLERVVLHHISFFPPGEKSEVTEQAWYWQNIS